MIGENVIDFKSIQKLQVKFIEKFEPEWRSFLENVYIDYSGATQLSIGNHTRPFLVLWGYLVNQDMDNPNITNDILQLAVGVEAIHKASVIIDDIIDGDTLRRGKKCMHIEYGEYPTIFFAVCMLSKAIKQVNTLLSINKNQSLQTKTVSLLCDTIYAMCHGAIEEITATPEQQISLDYVEEIIDSETAQLIKNSLLLGYLYNDINNPKLECNIHLIGRKCGYIFQIMNDLEAFCNPEYISRYKGDINSDFLRSRKSIVLPVLYQQCNSQERTILIDGISGAGSNFNEIKNLFDKYNLKQFFKEDIQNVYLSIKDLLAESDVLINNTKWINSFMLFIETTKKKYLNILG